MAHDGGSLVDHAVPSSCCFRLCMNLFRRPPIFRTGAQFTLSITCVTFSVWDFSLMLPVSGLSQEIGELSCMFFESKSHFVSRHIVSRLHHLGHATQWEEDRPDVLHSVLRLDPFAF